MRGIASSHPDSENARKWTLHLNQTTTTRGREKRSAGEKILLYAPTLNASEGVGNGTAIVCLILNSYRTAHCSSSNHNHPRPQPQPSTIHNHNHPQSTTIRGHNHNHPRPWEKVIFRESSLSIRSKIWFFFQLKQFDYEFFFWVISEGFRYKFYIIVKWCQQSQYWVVIKLISGIGICSIMNPLNLYRNYTKYK